MINKRNAPVDNRNENPQKRFTDEKTDEKIHKHLSDINDQISDKDIENIRTDIDKEIEETKRPDEGLEASDEKNNDDKQPTIQTEPVPAKESGVITPWNIINP
ncbi:MAG: hypothetical protein JWP81_3066 [Ferruginibacter sp.]|nr:hypothetical protein [Ferruginibacter sp.]